MPPNEKYVLRRVSDLAADWPRIWPLLRALDRHRLQLEPCEIPSNREESRRAEIAEILSTKSRILLAERDGKTRAVAVARVVSNPSVTVERVGLISDVFVSDEADAGTGEWNGSRLSFLLLAELESWLRGKAVDSFEIEVLARDETARSSLTEAGYASHKLELRKQLFI